VPSPGPQKKRWITTSLMTVCLYALSFHSLAYPYITVTALRSLSQKHDTHHNQRSARTHAASTIYNSIPIYYRRILDHLVRAKAAISSDWTIIAHAPVKKSEISAFLAPYFLQQTNPATELLRIVQDVEVTDSVSGELVPMFVEG